MVQSQPSVPPLIVPGLSTFAGRYDVVLCDLWGVMHDGQRSFGAAIAALQRFRAAGGTVIFITNAPRPRDPVTAQITGLGIPADAYDSIVTSGDVTVEAIAAEGDRAFHHIGPQRDETLFDAVEAMTGRRPRLTDLDSADIVVVSDLIDHDVETPADYADRLAAMRQRDLPMICANPDIVVHVGESLFYCGGALAEAYGALGGRTLLAGKPHAPIYEAALALAATARGGAIDRSRVLAIGDALVTDAAGAARQGLDLLFVTNGIHRGEFHPGPEETLDEQRYLDRLAAMIHPPMAALPNLVW